MKQPTFFADCLNILKVRINGHKWRCVRVSNPRTVSDMLLSGQCVEPTNIGRYIRRPRLYSSTVFLGFCNGLHCALQSLILHIILNIQ